MSQLCYASAMIWISSIRYLFVFLLCRRILSFLDYNFLIALKSQCDTVSIFRLSFLFFILYFFFGLVEKSGSISVFRMSVYSARRDFSERGLDEVSAVHGDPRLPTLGLGYLGPCSRDVLTVRLLKSTTTSTHYIVAR